MSHTYSPPQTETIEGLACALSELMAHLYVNTWSELSKLPSDPAGEKLLDKLFGAVADLDEIANKSGGRAVRTLLGDTCSTAVQ